MRDDRFAARFAARARKHHGAATAFVCVVQSMDLLMDVNHGKVPAPLLEAWRMRLLHYGERVAVRVPPAVRRDYPLHARMVGLNRNVRPHAVALCDDLRRITGGGVLSADLFDRWVRTVGRELETQGVKTFHDRPGARHVPFV